MIIEDRIDKALNIMKNNIINTMDIGKENSNWIYYISIYAKDTKSLLHVSELLGRLDILYKNIIMIPISYKTSTFDCIVINNIFGYMKSNTDYNTETISILECNSLDDGDFYITIVEESRENPYLNTIMMYGPLKSILMK